MFLVLLGPKVISTPKATPCPKVVNVQLSNMDVGVSQLLITPKAQPLILQLINLLSLLSTAPDKLVIKIPISLS